MIISLEGRTAIVTGGGTGIGRYIVKALSDAGADVAFTSRNKNSIEGTLKILNKGKNKGYVIDLSKKDNVPKFYKRFKDKSKMSIKILFHLIISFFLKLLNFSKI